MEILAALLLTLCAAFFSERVSAQAAGSYVVVKAVAKPEKVKQFEAAVKEEMAVYRKLKWPHASIAFSTLDYDFYFLTPIRGDTDVDSIRGYAAEQRSKSPELQALRARKLDALEHYSYRVIHFVPQVSHTPEGLDLTGEGAGFMYWGLMHVKPGHEQEFERNFARMKALYGGPITDYGWNMFRVEGADEPLYFNSIPGRNAVDYWTRKAEAQAKLDPQNVANTWFQIMPTLRRYEARLGAQRPDLSYTPNK